MRDSDDFWVVCKRASEVLERAHRTGNSDMCLTRHLPLLAKNQQETEAAAGITPVHRGLARAARNSPAPAEAY